MDFQIEYLYSKFLQSDGVSTDTRTIQPDNLFFALNGPNYKGSKFIPEALAKGASFAVTDDKDWLGKEKVTVVPNALIALQELATFHRSRYKRKLVALTGSNGKTTTKELIREVLAKKYIVHATSGNYNNHIGVPLTLLHIHPQVEIAIIEMGANRQGDIAELCGYANPTHGLITNIGHAHTETFGGITGVLKGKTELFQHLHDGQGFIFLNQEDPRLMSVWHKYQTNFKAYPEKDLQLITEHPYLTIRIGDKTTQTFLSGRYNFINIAAAVAVGRYFEVEDNAILSAIAQYQPTNMRSQLIKLADKTIILDAYNANPDSMRAAITNLAAFDGKKVAILGDMNELENPEESHREIVAHLQTSGIREAILIGKNFCAVANGNYQFFQSKHDAIAAIKEISLAGYTILIKASRSSQLETLLDLFDGTEKS